ncbi:hypothetical protein N657DRAFT_294587 [Parathielavia appendiculata]|uniref:Uncharacterized protein n=1 Tax=Parathielavia appendiculata TaxID=2587402 RepID=A0AAN6U460_9PEZI|nr:hypothetical protein N657DRAFT_294587 [Parathielavia appendiculata]
MIPMSSRRRPRGCAWRTGLHGVPAGGDRRPSRVPNSDLAIDITRRGGDCDCVVDLVTSENLGRLVMRAYPVYGGSRWRGIGALHGRAEKDSLKWCPSSRQWPVRSNKLVTRPVLHFAAVQELWATNNSSPEKGRKLSLVEWGGPDDGGRGGDHGVSLARVRQDTAM